MNFDKFKHLFHKSWHIKIKPFIESKECDEIYKFLKTESKENGKSISPLSFNVYRAFMETSLDNLKVVIIGERPYITNFEESPLADGLLLGCTVIDKVLPPLDKFYRGIEEELFDGLNLSYIQTPDVSYLSKQGVLMLNGSLTCEIGSESSHKDVWEPFIKFLFKNVFNTMDICVLLLGEAKDYNKYAVESLPCFYADNPVTCAKQKQEWNSNGVFRQIGKILVQKNNFEIDWLLTDEIPF